MNLLRTVTIGFLLLETVNVVVLYFFPGSKIANGVGVFNAWEQSKQDPEIHRFVRYLVNWVAGTKLIFIMLLVVLLVTAGSSLLIWMGAALVLAISSFFWRLYPLVRRMDREGEVDPRGYSRTLGWMITAVILLFLAGIVFALIG